MWERITGTELRGISLLFMKDAHCVDGEEWTAMAERYREFLCWTGWVRRRSDFLIWTGFRLVGRGAKRGSGLARCGKLILAVERAVNLEPRPATAWREGSVCVHGPGLADAMKRVDNWHLQHLRF
jgi:hypothetical protein